MIKHTCICDCCGKEEQLRSVDFLFSKKTDKNYDVWELPEHWEEHGILPKYTLCGKCSAELKCKIQDTIYTFVTLKPIAGEPKSK